MNVTRSYNVSPDVFFKIDLNNSIRRNDRDIKAYIGFNDSWNTRVVESTYEGLGYASGVVMPSSVVLSSLPKVGAVVREYPIISEKLSNAALSRQWMESYNHEGKVNRVHPKSINGQPVNSIHYPPTQKELEEMK